LDKNMSDKGHNGWTNYATWRINLEIISQYDWAEEPFVNELTVSYLEELVEQAVFGEGNERKEDLLKDSYASAFISEVNYYEILEHIKEEVSNENEAREFLNKK
tara:strand:+ start:183 stop:494 length:312 start_codon:yes stop_codon:yes gene_type:complete